MKKLLSSLLALVALTSAACQTIDDNSLLMQDQTSLESSILSKSTRKVPLRTDWYETLSPDLQAYYAPAKGKLGADLFNSLHTIISKGQKVSDYKTAKGFMYSDVDNIVVNGQSGLYDSYSYIFAPGKGADGNLYTESGDQNNDGYQKDFINCEHTWPQSFFNKVTPMVSDIHHLFPTMSVPNAMRSNNPFGEATKDGRLVIYETNGGSKLGVIDSKNRSFDELKKLINLPYEQRPNLEKELDSVFEPGDRQKGNTARAMMYFFLRYYDESVKGGAYDEKKFWDSKVPVFIKWSEQVDSVDELEVKRHQVAANKQGNRNPFIDIPNLGTLITEQVLETK